MGVIRCVSGMEVDYSQGSLRQASFWSLGPREGNGTNSGGGGGGGEEGGY